MIAMFRKNQITDLKIKKHEDWFLLGNLYLLNQKEFPLARSSISGTYQCSLRQIRASHIDVVTNRAHELLLCVL